jgi:hypothetical protein
MGNFMGHFLLYLLLVWTCQKGHNYCGIWVHIWDLNRTLKVWGSRLCQKKTYHIIWHNLPVMVTQFVIVTKIFVENVFKKVVESPTPHFNVTEWSYPFQYCSVHSYILVKAPGELVSTSLVMQCNQDNHQRLDHSIVHSLSKRLLDWTMLAGL